MPVYAQNDDLVPFSGFRWVSKSTLRATFSVKMVQRVESFTWPGAPWRRPGRDLAPKTLQGHNFFNLGAFSVAFEMVDARLWADSLRFGAPFHRFSDEL